MKVHNLGSDYAYQRKLKQEHLSEVKPLDSQTITEETSKTNAGDKIQARGEGETVAGPCRSKNQKKKIQRKKEEGAEEVELQD